MGVSSATCSLTQGPCTVEELLYPVASPCLPVPPFLSCDLRRGREASADALSAEMSRPQVENFPASLLGEGSGSPVLPGCWVLRQAPSLLSLLC